MMMEHQATSKASKKETEKKKKMLTNESNITELPDNCFSCSMPHSHILIL
jgi:hypothetical protein